MNLPPTLPLTQAAMRYHSGFQILARQQEAVHRLSVLYPDDWKQRLEQCVHRSKTSFFSLEQVIEEHIHDQT